MTEHIDKIQQAIQETAALIEPFSLSFSQQYASSGSDRLSIAKDFAASQECITPESQAVALMAVRVAVLENNIVDQLHQEDETCL